MNKETVLVRIYELRDPRDLECSPKYIGITVKKLYDRLGQHTSKRPLSFTSKKNSWIKSLLKDNIRPTIHLIEEVIGWEYAYKVEKYWIKEFRNQGYDLKNSVDGGSGTLGYKFTPEQRKKVSESSKGKPKSKEAIEKMRQSKLGVPASEHFKQLMSNRMKGKPFSNQPLAQKIRQELYGKRVVMLTKNLEFIQEFYLIADALRFLNKTLNNSAITSCCKNKKKSAFGYKWMYKEDYLKLNLNNL